jgi:hypothetical protein
MFSFTPKLNVNPSSIKFYLFRNPKKKLNQFTKINVFFQTILSSAWSKGNILNKICKLIDINVGDDDGDNTVKKGKNFNK